MDNKQVSKSVINVFLAAVATLLFATLFASKAAAGPIDTYTFPDEVMKVRFQHLTYELRCPKCQNQNLADSNSPIAQDLRHEVYEMLLDGRSDTEIMDFMVDRYGEYVLYRPRVNSLTYLLWFGPVVFILIGGFVVFLFVRKKEVKTAALSDDQQQQLNSILKDD
ncbi:cytochrome c-type biogenesis protein CcmH [Thalassomonas sp. M1454]|uniref:cytochrome c-type biogenesis protein n=1 Tax=Thalassomonas sp. M1454 TaxID=2594477 RepID=UPI001180867E|nr:cytochrome c-type biogenesis protein [Thalassomonas sp. M1454]TRX54013.1 cytochrome c-type biogenesis protein CcmH [Thalassomonas sp. M1454]